MPVVDRLEKKYADELVVVGVHAGKFIAERVTENIRTATRRLEIAHPVVNDKAFRTWRAYGVNSWPTIVLISPDGQYIGQHSGEFTFEQFDQIIGLMSETYKKEGLLNSGPLHFEVDPDPSPPSGPLRFPGKVLADPVGGRLFISDTGNNRILITTVGKD
ncbi:MAG: thioredoxin-like domain-containing protein, partial [Chloroflexia bacterium]